MKRITPLTILAGTCIAAQIAQATPTVEFQTDSMLFSCDNMSSDGRYVCGNARGVSGFFPEGTFIWDTQTGLITLLNTAGKDAVAITEDGSTVVGDTLVEGTPGDPNSWAEEASYWTESAGFWQSIGFLPNAMQCPSRSNAYDISADGSVIVGLSWDGCSGRGFRWTEATGMQELESARQRQQPRKRRVRRRQRHRRVRTRHIQPHARGLGRNHAPGHAPRTERRRRRGRSPRHER